MAVCVLDPMEIYSVKTNESERHSRAMVKPISRQ